MGRGDRKTAKGKTAIRSYGNVRPHTATKAVVTKSTVTVKPTVKKAAPVTAKKAATKKSA